MSEIITEVKPRWEHDCQRCQFLGRYDFAGPLSDDTTEACQADLYYCEGSLGGSLIGRMSSRDSDYASTPLSLVIRDEERMRAQPATHTPAILEALRRVRKDFGEDFITQALKRKASPKPSYDMQCATEAYMGLTTIVARVSLMPESMRDVVCWLREEAAREEGVEQAALQGFAAVLEKLIADTEGE